jgi:cell division protein FtsQ
MTVPGDTASDGLGRPGQVSAGQVSAGQGRPDAGPGRPGPGPGPASGAGPAGGPGAGSGAGPEGAGDRRPGRPSRLSGAPWRAAFIVVLAVLIVAGAGWALLGSSLLVVRHVQVSGNRGMPAAEVSAASGIERGTPLARLNSAVAERGIERIPRVLSAQVSRSWPDTVVIAVRERTPRLAVAAGAGFELVDRYGVVVRQSSARPAGMPLLKSPPAQLRGSAAVAAAAAVLARLPAALRARVLAVTDTAATGVTLQLRGRVTVRWGDARRSAAKATEVQALLRTGARYVDVSSSRAAVTGR